MRYHNALKFCFPFDGKKILNTLNSVINKIKL